MRARWYMIAFKTSKARVRERGLRSVQYASFIEGTRRFSHTLWLRTLIVILPGRTRANIAWPHAVQECLRRWYSTRWNKVRLLAARTATYCYCRAADINAVCFVMSYPRALLGVDVYGVSWKQTCTCQKNSEIDCRSWNVTAFSSATGSWRILFWQVVIKNERNT